MWKQTKLLLALVAAVALPLGRFYECSRHSVQFRSCLSWAGQRVSPYRAEDNELSRWIREDLHVSFKHDEWHQTSGGPFWCPWVSGTPQGNWIWLRSLHQCYIKAPADEKAEVSALATQLLTSNTDPRPIVREAYDRWLSQR